MVDVFGATSTTEEVLCGVNLHGKRILVTGVSAGIGAETARSRAAHGAQVVGAARNLAKAKTATAPVLKEGTFNVGSFELIELVSPILRAFDAAPMHSSQRVNSSTWSSPMQE
jgi:NAD(P)-dependent dehydrogenase (short-subunit alcohol dehydrogenase family)